MKQVLDDSRHFVDPQKCWLAKLNKSKYIHHVSLSTVTGDTGADYGLYLHSDIKKQLVTPFLRCRQALSLNVQNEVVRPRRRQATRGSSGPWLILDPTNSFTSHGEE